MPVSVSYNKGDICDWDENDIEPAVISGGIFLSSEENTKGDINGDGKVNAVDANMLKQIILGNI